MLYRMESKIPENFESGHGRPAEAKERVQLLDTLSHSLTLSFTINKLLKYLNEGSVIWMLFPCLLCR